MNGCIFLRDRMLYTACRTALLLLTSTVYTCNSNADIHDQWPIANGADNSVMWHIARIKWPNATHYRHSFSHVTTTAVTWPRLIWFEDSRMVLLHSAPGKAPAKSVLWRSACHWRMPEGRPYNNLTVPMRRTGSLRPNQSYTAQTRWLYSQWNCNKLRWVEFT